MSIIGPRPGDVESKDTYAQDEKDKLLIRPGITGYTQAYYRNNLGVREKRLYDAWYPVFIDMSNVIAGVIRDQYNHLTEHISQKKAIYTSPSRWHRR